MPTKIFKILKKATGLKFIHRDFCPKASPHSAFFANIAFDQEKRNLGLQAVLGLHRGGQGAKASEEEK